MNLKRHLNRGVNLALLLLFSYSLITLIILCLGCTVQPAFYLWGALLCLSTWLTTCTRNGFWAGLPASALLLFGASRYFSPDLSQQLNDLFDRLTGAYMEQILFPGDTYAYLNAAADHSLLFLFLVFLLSSYMGAAISSRSGRIGLALLGSVPFFLTCLAVTVKPPVLSLLGMMLFWFLLAAGGSHFDEDSECYLRVLGALVPLSLLLSLLLLYVNPEEYYYEPDRPEINRTLEDWLQKLDEWLNGLPESERLNDPDAVPPSAEIDDDYPEALPSRPPIPWQDQRGNMDLTHSVDPKVLETIFLRVKTQQSSSIYLRTVSYGDYTGTGWAPAEEGAVSSSLPFVALAATQADTDELNLDVRVLQDSAYRYLPYFSPEEGGYDSFVPSGMQEAYTVPYRAFPESFEALTLPAWKSDSELAYRNYAHDYYTRLPTSTFTAMQEICQANGFYAGMDDVISQVASFVQRTGDYVLNVGSYPSGDYAAYFLTESHQGCCVHFATAAAALYRCLGVPARITEGFLAETQAGRYTDVKGYQAHAWVEVYRDGLGWLPVEVTGQSGLDTQALGAGETAPSPEPETTLEEPAPPPQEVEPTSSPSLPVGLLSQSAIDQETDASGRSSRLLVYLLALLVAVAFLPIRRLLVLAWRYRQFEQPDTRKAVIAMYQTAQKASALGVSTPEILLRTAERAAFSQHEICGEEVNACRDQLYITLKSCYLKQNAWGKFRFKLLHALL